MMGPHLISRFNSGGSGGSSLQFRLRQPSHLVQFLFAQGGQAVLCGGQSVHDLCHAFVACQQPKVSTTRQQNTSARHVSTTCQHYNRENRSA
jgi:hypothetical protein